MAHRERSTIMSRAGALLTVAALAAGTVVAGATAAHAAGGAQSYGFIYSSNKIEVIRGDGTPAGYVRWHADPSGSTPGDALLAYDGLADGYGIVAHLSTGRTASTLGHPSPYSTGWVTGNLPEGHHYTMWAVVAKGNDSIASGDVQVTA